MLSSTLNNQNELIRLEGLPKYWNNVKMKASVTHHPHYLLVRNPYDRLESFFKEKLRKCVLQTKADPPYQLKLHQEIFYPYLGIDNLNTSLDDKIKIFLDFSFENYIKTLPEVYLLDQHLKPQSYSYRSRIIFLSNKLGINTNIRVNATSDLKNEVNWTPVLRTIVNLLYDKDFEELDYKLIKN